MCIRGRYSMRHLRTTLAAAVCLVAAEARTLPAQAAVGERVRVRTTERERVVGRLEYLDTDSLVLSDGMGVRRSLIVAGVTRLEVSRGRHRRVLAGAVVGTLAGALIGTGVGVALDANEDADYEARCRARDSANCGSRWFDGIEIGVGAVLGSGIGLATGIIAGSIRVEQWKAVPLSDRVAMLAVPSGVGLSLRF